jgi:hypothetical protein
MLAVQDDDEDVDGDIDGDRNSDMDEAGNDNEHFASPIVDAEVEHRASEALAALIRRRNRISTTAQNTGDDPTIPDVVKEFFPSVVALKVDDAPLWRVPVKVCLYDFPCLLNDH